MSSSFEALAGALGERFEAGVDGALPDDDFDDLARRVFAFQYECNGVYRAFCDGRGVTPEAWPGWSGVPPVPATAFKHLPLFSGTRDQVEAIFRTSGTTRGGGRRGEHRIRSLELYRRAALPNLAAHLVAGLEPPLRIVSLIPPVETAPDSSLSRMMGFALEAWGDEGSGSVAHPEEGLDVEALTTALREAAGDGRPALVAGTAFAFVHWIDAVARGDGPSVELPAGSRLMETGGFKGRSREVPRDRLYADLTRVLGIPETHMVNEYGMTELLSQFYEPVLRESCSGAASTDLSSRHHVGPPWVRTRIVDPVTLAPVAEGEAGLLCHHDLANLGSVACILTEDRGVRVGAGFRVLGRSPGAEPRGCSLALEELLT